jgi:hypothetical protein
MLRLKYFIDISKATDPTDPRTMAMYASTLI